MAGEYCFDVLAQFDLQELKNAIHQVEKEIATRYDLKDSKAKIELGKEKIDLQAVDEFKIKSVKSVLVEKMIKRGVSPKILEEKEILPAAQDTVKQEIFLKMKMDSEQCKQVSKFLKENLKGVKTSIQGDIVRVSSKSKDELQMAMKLLKENEGKFKLPLKFNNFR